MLVILEQPGQIVMSLAFIHDALETSDAFIIAAVPGQAESHGLDVDSVVGVQIACLADALLGGSPFAMSGLADAHLIPERRLFGVDGQSLAVPSQRSLIVAAILLDLGKP